MLIVSYEVNAFNKMDQLLDLVKVSGESDVSNIAHLYDFNYMWKVLSPVHA